jgi:aspartate kinase
MVPDARHLPEVSFPVMQEMSTAGAKVLHASAVQFAKEKNIAIYARATFSPGRETIVRQLSPGAVVGVQAVVSEKQVERVRLHANDIHGCFKNTVDYLEKNQVPIKEVNFTDLPAGAEQSAASFIVSTKDIYGWARIKSALVHNLKEKIVFDADLGALSLIGEGLNRNNLTLLETLDLLAEKQIKVLGIATTAFRISLLVPVEQIENSVALCHTRWVANNGK